MLQFVQSFSWALQSNAIKLVILQLGLTAIPKTRTLDVNTAWTIKHTLQRVDDDKQQTSWLEQRRWGLLITMVGQVVGTASRSAQHGKNFK